MSHRFPVRSVCTALAVALLLAPVFVPAPPLAALDDLFDDPDGGIIWGDEGDTRHDPRDDPREGSDTREGSGTGSSIDDLFSDPSAGIIEDDDPADGDGPVAPGGTAPAGGAAGGAVDIAALTTSPPRFSGSVDTGAGITVGVSEWPGSSAADGQDLQDLLSWRAGYDMSATMRVTARPRPYLRFTGTLTTSLSESTARFSNPAIGDLFVDYTLGDTVFFRVGKFGMTWGQARILTNIGNLVSDVSGGAAVRATVPIGPGTATALVYTRQAEIAKHGSGDPKSFTYAGQVEATRGRLSAGAAAWLRAEEPLRSTLHATLGLGTVDLTQELRVFVDRQDPLNMDTMDVATLSQIVWEGGNPVWRVIGEYLFDSTVADWQGHRVGLGVRMPRFLPGSWRPEVLWRHAFVDNSGSVEVAATGTLAPSLEGSIGMPILYGEPGTIFRVDDTTIPSNGVVSVLVAARLKFSF